MIFLTNHDCWTSWCSENVSTSPPIRWLTVASWRRNRSKVDHQIGICEGKVPGKVPGNQCHYGQMFLSIHDFTRLTVTHIDYRRLGGKRCRTEILLGHLKGHRNSHIPQKSADIQLAKSTQPISLVIHEPQMWTNDPMYHPELPHPLRNKTNCSHSNPLEDICYQRAASVLPSSGTSTFFLSSFRRWPWWDPDFFTWPEYY